MCFLIVRDVLVQNGSTLKFILKRIDEEKDRICTILALDILSKCVIGLNYCQKALTELLQVCPSHTQTNLTLYMHNQNEIELIVYLRTPKRIPITLECFMLLLLTNDYS